MLRDYAALAPEQPGLDGQAGSSPGRFRPETGVEPPPPGPPPPPTTGPAIATTPGGAAARRPRCRRTCSVLWTAELGDWPAGAIADDWRENPFIRGPVTAPVAAGGLVYVARGRRPPSRRAGPADRQAALAVHRQRPRRHAADDPPRPVPVRHARAAGCTALRADDGRLVWRLRAAPHDERIVAYGQIESPWPVPGSVLVVDDAAYFAAGRQPLADGGILALPPTGQRPGALGPAAEHGAARPTSTPAAAWSSTTSICCTGKATRWPCRAGCSAAPRAR